MPVIPRVVGRRLPRHKQEEINAGVAAIFEARFNKRLDRARQKKQAQTTDALAATDDPNIIYAIMNARRSLVSRSWWSDLSEDTKEALLENSDRVQRGLITSSEWARLVTQAQSVSRGVEIVARPDNRTRNVNMLKLPFDF